MPARKTPNAQSSELANSVSPHAVFDAARSGDELRLLTATRDRISMAIDDPTTPARDLAALTKRLVDISQQIAAVKEQQSDAEEEDLIGDAQFDPSTV